ncbi:MAG: sensor histidine kinase [Pilosibacter sp.]
MRNFPPAVLRSGRSHSGIYCDPGCNIITCEDTGRGIRPDLIDRIYEKGVSSKGTNRGTGLFLIKQLVDSGNGEISIETEPGEGTCFTITFTERKHTPCTM